LTFAAGGPALLGLACLLRAAPAQARARWDPSVFARAQTIELRTQAPGEDPHWFKVWVVVLDGSVYVRLGNRAAHRIETNVTKPFVAVRVDGREYPRVRGEPAPEMAERVAAAMAEKYRMDLLIRYFPHPLTMRLVPADSEGAGR